MRVWWNRKPISTLSAAPKARPATRAERGQALIVIAMAMIGLLAFVGLTIDSGILFIAEGHLRRAVDAASLAAAAQFRVGSPHSQLFNSAKEVVHLNGVDPATLILTLCDPTDPQFDDSTINPGSTMCTGPTHRKLVKVVATTQVRFAFLSIIGIPSTIIQAESVSEAASVDVVLVIDTSNSMTFDVNKWTDTFSVGPNEVSSYWFPNGPVTETVPGGDGCNQDPLHKNPDPTYTGYCLPFDQVKKAAVNFISHLYWPYDRLSIVTFNITPTVVLPLTNSDTQAQWEGIVKQLNVSAPQDPPATGCEWAHYASDTSGSDPSTDPSGCTNTSTGGGLKLAGLQFALPPIRQESVWVVILLTDGSANASEPRATLDPLHPTLNQSNAACPPTTWKDTTNDPKAFDPFCRDWDKTTRHTVLNPQVYVTSGIDPTHTVPYGSELQYLNTPNYNNTTYDPAHYDADDYARDQADYVACPAKLAQAQKNAPWCMNSLDYSINQGGQGALIFAIGLGNLVINNSGGGGTVVGGVENRVPPSVYGATTQVGTNLGAGYDAGDSLLRYIANVGLNNNPDPYTPGGVPDDPCLSVKPPILNYDLAHPDNAPTLATTGNLSYNCGNYFFSQTGTGLNDVFLSIASRIFTRITQ